MALALSLDAEAAVPGSSEASLELHHPADSLDALVVDLAFAGVEHSDAAGFTARTYAHIMRDASKRRRVSIARAITNARRPLVDPETPETSPSTDESAGKVLQIREADARIRTADPFITSEVLYQLSYVGASVECSALGRLR
jgi:hypothetical protein